VNAEKRAAKRDRWNAICLSPPPNCCPVFAKEAQRAGEDRGNA
jgi:hypothetical protein